MLALGQRESDPGPEAGGALKGSRRDRILGLIRSGKADWERVVNMASNHYVLQTLYLKFRQNQLLDELPPDLAGHLEYIFNLNLDRNKKIYRQASEINRLLKKGGITPVFMKGAGNLADGLYFSNGERIMSDIDVLVPSGQTGDAGRILLESGYRSGKEVSHNKAEAAKHLPELFKDGEPAFVDIHRFPVNIQFSRHLDPGEVISCSRPGLAGPEFMVMSDRHKILLGFIHSQLVHWGHQTAVPFLRELYDLLLLSQRENPAAVLNDPASLRGRAAGYLRVFHETFGIDRELPGEMKQRGRLYLARHRLAISNTRHGKVLYKILRTARLWFIIPFRSLFDKNYRLYVKVRLKDPEWYKRNFGT